MVRELRQPRRPCQQQDHQEAQRSLLLQGQLFVDHVAVEDENSQEGKGREAQRGDHQNGADDGEEDR